MKKWNTQATKGIYVYYFQNQNESVRLLITNCERFARRYLNGSEKEDLINYVNTLKPFLQIDY